MTQKQYFNVGSIVQIQVNGELSSSHWLKRYNVASISTPDITINFVEKIPNTVRYIDLHKTGITDDGFIFFTKDHPAKKVLVRFEELGSGMTIVCEKGANQIPYLDMLIHSITLIKQGLPLHASAFYADDKIWLTSGYPQGGKTSVLLAFMNNGAKFISDDWAYITDDNRVLGLALPITLRRWQLQQLPAIRSQVSTGKLSVFAGMKAALDMLASVAILPKSIRRSLNKLSDKVADKLYVTSHPYKVFKNQLMTQSGAVDRVLLSISHDDPQIIVEPVTTDMGIRQLFAMQHKEWHDFFAFLSTYIKLFPDKRNVYIGELSTILENQLNDCFKNTQFYYVYHPHPVNLQQIHNIILSEIR